MGLMCLPLYLVNKQPLLGAAWKDVLLDQLHCCVLWPQRRIHVHSVAHAGISGCGGRGRLDMDGLS